MLLPWYASVVHIIKLAQTLMLLLVDIQTTFWHISQYREIEFWTRGMNEVEETKISMIYTHNHVSTKIT